MFRTHVDPGGRGRSRQLFRRGTPAPDAARNGEPRGRGTLSGPLRLHEMHLARVTDSAEFFSVGADSFGELTSRNLSGVYACFTVGADREIEFSDHFAQIHTNWHSGRHKGKFTLDQIFGVTPDVVRNVGHMYIECGERSLEFHSAYLFDASKLSDTGS